MSGELRCDKCKNPLRPGARVTPIHKVDEETRYRGKEVGFQPVAWQHLECPPPKKTPDYTTLHRPWPTKEGTTVCYICGHLWPCASSKNALG